MQSRRFVIRIRNTDQFMRQSRTYGDLDYAQMFQTREAAEKRARRQRAWAQRMQNYYPGWNHQDPELDVVELRLEVED